MGFKAWTECTGKAKPGQGAPWAMKDEWMTHAPGQVPEPGFEPRSYWPAVQCATARPQEAPIRRLSADTTYHFLCTQQYTTGIWVGKALYV